MYGASVHAQSALGHRRLGRLMTELIVSIIVAALIASMVAVGGAALAWAPTEPDDGGAATQIDRPGPLVVCRDDHIGLRCIPEAT